MTSEVLMRPQQPPPPQPQPQVSPPPPPATTNTTTNNNNNNMKEMKESQDKLIESVYRISSEIIHHKWLHKQK